MNKIIGYGVDLYHDGLFQENDHIANGKQFTRLCRDLLNSPYNIWLPLSNNYVLWPQSEGIADGGIDIIAVSQTTSSEVFFQCKYKKDQNGAKGILRSILSTLQKQLNNDTAQRYSPWQTHPVNTYVICLSCEINQGTIDDFKSQLKALFAQVSQQPGMGHLAMLNIIILYDAIFREILENDPTLSRKWLMMSTAIEELDRDSEKQLEKFADFLDSKHLRYFSRANFKKSTNYSQTEQFDDEDDILEYLRIPDNRAVIIYGQGGIGKTRLTLELGRKGKAYYQVFKVKSTLKSLEELVKATRNEANYLLLFDYIEEQPLFIETLRWLEDTRIINIKVIANCRASFKDGVKEAIGTSGFKFIDVGLRNPIELLYKKEVVRFIINTIPDRKLAIRMKFDRNLHSFCQERPAFAVFIKYLNFKNPGCEYLINKDSSFENWLLGRLKLSLDGDRTGNLTKKHKEVFMFMSCLPAIGRARQNLRKDFLEKATILIKDGWIDDDNQTTTVVHDTVNDILLSYLLDYYEYDSVVVEELLHFSITYNSLSSMLRAIERVWTDKSAQSGSLKQIELQTQIAATIRLFLNESIASEHWFREQLAYTPLISEEERINILFEFRQDLPDTFTKEQYGHSLSYSMNWVANHQNWQSQKLYTDRLKQIFFDYWNQKGRFDDFIHKPILGGRIISTYVNLFGIDPYIEKQLDCYLALTTVVPVNLEYLSYVLASLLWAKKVVSRSVADLVHEWVNVFTQQKHEYFNPGFLLEPWCKFSGQVKIIRPILILFLRDEHIYISVRATVIGHWLEYCDEPLLVKPFIQNCLSAQISPAAACNLMSFWLKSGDEPLLIKPFLAKWLEYSTETSICSFVFQYWLRFGDEPNLILPAINGWLAVETNQITVGNVLRYFMEMGGKGTDIEEGALAWLQDNIMSATSINIIGFWLMQDLSKNMFNKLKPKMLACLDYHLDKVRETGHILDKWLILGYETEMATTYITRWLELYIDSLQAGLLMKSWLENGKDKQLLEPFVLPFLERYQHLKESSGFISTWIVKADDYLLIRSGVIGFLDSCSEEQEARYVITNWLERTAEPGLVKNAVIKWLAKNGDQPDSTYVVSFWLKFGKDHTIVSDYINRQFGDHLTVKDSNRVIEAWLQCGGAKELIRTHTINYLASVPMLRNSIWVAYWWLKESGNLQEVEIFLFQRFNEYCVYNEAELLINVCLKKKLGEERMLPIVQFFISQHIDAPFAISVINTWLDEGLNAKPLMSYINYIHTHYNAFSDFSEIADDEIRQPLNLEAITMGRQFYLSKKIVHHLNSGDSPNTVWCEVEAYLSDFGRNVAASWVLSAWIEHGGDIEVVLEALRQWLNLYLLTEIKSSFLVGVLLEHSEGYCIAHDYALDWLGKYGHTDDAKYILSSWLKNKELYVKEILFWIDYWTENHFDNNHQIDEVANWRVKILTEGYYSRHKKK